VAACERLRTETTPLENNYSVIARLYASQSVCESHTSSAGYVTVRTVTLFIN